MEEAILEVYVSRQKDARSGGTSGNSADCGRNATQTCALGR